MFDFESTLDHKQNFSTKWCKYQDGDVLPLWIADSDYQTAPAVIEALQERVSHGVFGYTKQATDEVNEAIVYHAKSRYDRDIKTEWIVPLNSIVSGLLLACLIAGDEGDEAMTASTIYPPFKYVINTSKRSIIPIPMKLSEDRWKLDFTALQAAITPKTRILLFCNPHNPGGVVYSKAELEELHSICQRHDLLICSDEIHCDLILDEDKTHIPIASLNEDAASRTITLMAASKAYNIAGLGFGFAIISNQKLRKQYQEMSRNRMPEVNLLAQVATAAAFKQGEDWRKAQIIHLRKNRDYLFKEINSIPGLKMYPLESTFLAWVDVSSLKLDNAEKFFENKGVGISAGTYFGDSNFIRINFACSTDTLTEAVSRIRKAITGLSNTG